MKKIGIRTFIGYTISGLWWCMCILTHIKIFIKRRFYNLKKIKKYRYKHKKNKNILKTLLSILKTYHAYILIVIILLLWLYIDMSRKQIDIYNNLEYKHTKQAVTYAYMFNNGDFVVDIKKLGEDGGKKVIFLLE